MATELENFTFHRLKIDDIKSIIHTRLIDAHKGDFGHAILIAGSRGMMGACVLSAKSILRSGAGLVTVCIPQSAELIMQTSVPEAMIIIDPNENYISTCPNLDKYSVVGVGPGIGTASKTKNAISDLIKTVKVPTIFDADALNIIAEDTKLLNDIPKESILTPHVKEFTRIVGKFDNINDRTALQVDLSKKYHINILVKGHETCMTNSNGDIFINTTGNPGMATGGSGDVLTGIITGLIARGLKPFDAMIAGVYLHGLSGDLAKESLGEESMTAQDLIDNLGQSFLQIL
ncbi:MAG: NAD(P)H-hydrate dehydratase [Candidatus Neomarinimicrobiota bacterium]|nr:NAD(P)H-hydrate dehydratase [Candidatus Neomarinimicrobiota bacterium]